MSLVQAWFRLVFGRPQGLRRSAARALWARLTPAAPPPEAPAPTQEPAVARAPAFDPTGYERLFPLSELEDGEVTEAVVMGVAVAVCRLGDAVHVVDNTCPHAGGPMGDGAVEDGALVCPLHGWRFDLNTGACDVDASAVLPVWRAAIVDGEVWAAPPA